MGIRNDAVEVAHRGGLHLTTPHGDQKPHNRCLARLGAKSRTHYPSWGSETDLGPVLRRLDMISLPLMGIRNYKCHARSSTSDRTHYPSWGSETRRASRSGFLSTVISLPLMGIRNSRPSGHDSVTSISLPLMGIRNSTSSRSGSGRQSSHYPSWGSETAVHSQAAMIQ